MATEKRAVDTSKKSNVKCEHCKYWDYGNISLDGSGNRCAKCGKCGEIKKYYNRCRYFDWRENIKEAAGGGSQQLLQSAT